MNSGSASAFQVRPLAWWELFGIGFTALALVIYEAWPSSPPVAYPAPLRSPVPTPAPVPPALQPPAPISPVQTMKPANTFTPSRIAPAELPPSLSGLSRPPKDPPPLEPLVGEQPGYVIPARPRPREIR